MEPQDLQKAESTPAAEENPAPKQDMMGLFRCIVAGYLVYLGGSLAVSVWQGETTNAVLYGIAALLFLAGGVFFLIRDLPAACKKLFSSHS